MIKILRYSNGKVAKGSLNDLKKNITTWLDCYNPTADDLNQISRFTKIPSKIITDNLGDIRPRIDETSNYSLIVYSAPLGAKSSISSIAMFILKNKNILTFSKEKIPIIDVVNKLINEKPGLLKKPSEIVYTLLSNINSSYFLKMEEMEEVIDEIENIVFEHPDEEHAREIFKIKKRLIYLHKALVANREVISEIEKQYISRFTKEESYKFREFYHNLTQLIDEGETLRDITTGVLDLYLTSVSNNLNIVMKKLTAMASFILIPTLISGIYGMNFQKISSWNMPELYWGYGYFFALGLMVLSVVVMYIFFRRKDWI